MPKPTTKRTTAKVEPVWLSPSTGAAYSDCSTKTFYSLLNEGLRHVRMPSGRIRVKKEWIDEFFESLEADRGQALDAAVDDMVRAFGIGGKSR